MEVAVFSTKSYDREFLGRIEQAGPIRWRFHDFRLSSETAELAKGCKAVCAFVNDNADADCLRILSALGVGIIAFRCAGFNNVDIAAAKRLDIALTRVPAYSPHAVAEHTVALLLCLNRKIHRSYNRVREHNFSIEGLVGFDLHGKTAAVIGTGKIGRLVAERFKGFGMDVVACDPFPAKEWASMNGVTYVTFENALSRSDVVSLHMPLTPETRHMVDGEALRRMKSGSYLINTSRGKLIDTHALIEALKDGTLSGVALDVYEEEEGLFFEDRSNSVLQDDELTRLLTFPNVLITAHQAFLTREALTEIGRVTVENLRRFDAGEPFLDGTAI
jgi:D-lactate dehydrogenase